MSANDLEEVASAGDGGASRPRLLLVEDDAELREQLKWALMSGYAILEADSRAAALEVWRRERPPLIVLDLGLPPYTHEASEGLKLLEECLALDPLAKVIITTGSADKRNAFQAVQQGAFDYIQKPIELDMLRIVLQRAAYLRGLEEEAKPVQRAADTSFQGMLGASPAMQRVFTMVRRLANADVPVLVTGESGTGKSLIARAIHQHGGRQGGPFVAINCGAIPEHLLESELFGHEKGAFTGAHIQRKGRIELAHGGVLFLDEVCELSLALQVKLLHVLQDQRIVRVGGREEIPVDARVIAASNQDLRKAIKEGRFREDLFYRLQVVSIDLPPLRERREDILPLAHWSLRRFCTEEGKKILGFTRQAVKAMETHDWPGNVRELENRIKRGILMTDGPRLGIDDLELAASPAPDEGKTLRFARQAIEKECIERALGKYHGNVTRAAAELGISRPTLHGLLTKHAIER